jgi:hypothetical protein
MPGSPQWSLFPQVSPPKSYTRLSPSHPRDMPCPSHFLDFITRTILGKECNTAYLYLMKYSLSIKYLEYERRTSWRHRLPFVLL